MTNTVINPSRRRFIRNSAMLAVGSALAANSFTFTTASASSPKNISMANLASVSDGDLAILNYALTLEHLESKAYAVINASGLEAETCFDAAASRYSAVFKMPAGAPTAWVVLSTVSKEKPVVYLQMFDSLRILP